MESLQDVTSESAAVKFIANTAVFALEAGGEEAVSGDWTGHIGTNGQGTYLYRDVWGSRMFPYEVTVELAPGLIPVKIEWDEEARNLNGTMVGLGLNGFRIRIGTTGKDQTDIRGVGKLDIYFIHNLEVWNGLRSMDLFDQREVTFAEFFMLMHLLFRKWTES